MRNKKLTTGVCAARFESLFDGSVLIDRKCERKAGVRLDSEVSLPGRAVMVKPIIQGKPSFKLFFYENVM